MRERRLQASVALCKAGITPARAGKTMLPISTNPLSSDPPRSCGKDCRPFGMLLLPSGSPPLVRERLADLPDDNGMDRITPARAGKTMNSRYVFGQRRDHPRSCGKDFAVTYRMKHKTGSPPLVRERLGPAFHTTIIHRITPARAGKTRSQPSCLCRSRDHPRSCGKDRSQPFPYHP